MKLNNLSRLTALLLALMILMTSVVWADPVADTEWDSTSYQTMLSAVTEDCLCVTYYASALPLDQMNGHTCVYEFLLTLGTTNQYQFLVDLDNGQYQYLVDEETNKYSSYSISDFLGAYYAHIDGTNGTKLDPLMCTCTDNLNGTYFNYEPGNGKHNEGCPWYEATESSVVIWPPMPDPIPSKDPSKFEQYTSNETYSLPMADDRAIILPEGGRAVIHSDEANGYQWQVYDGTQWVAISGENAADLVVTTAKLATIFNLTSIAEIRYFDEANNIVKASVSVTSQEIAGGEYVDPAVVEEAQTLSVIPREGETVGTYTIKVYYYYEDTTTPVYREDSATYSAGATDTWTVTYPTLVGYEAWWMGVEGDADNETAASTSHTININALNENISYVVYYKPANVGFKVLHYLQNTDDDNYAAPIEVNWDGYTNESVLAQLNGQDKNALIDTGFNENGFYALPFSTDGVIVAADGSTEVEIYYDRYYRLINFELNGGSGVEPIYTKYGTPISIDEPERTGYSFVGWDLVVDANNDGKPDQDQNGNYVGDGIAETDMPTTMTAENRIYLALWEEAETTYTVVYWFENANDTNYSVVHVAHQAATTGTTVNSTNMPEISSYTDADLLEDPKHFTHNTDKDADYTIAGDGSTIVNVYYTRETYTLRFYYARKVEDDDRVYIADTGGDDGKPLAEFKWNITDGEASPYSEATTELPTITAKYRGGLDEQEITVGSGRNQTTYTYYYYDLTAKYNADIADQWPDNFYDRDEHGLYNGQYILNSWYVHRNMSLYDNGGGDGSTVHTFKGTYYQMNDAILALDSTDPIIRDNAAIDGYFVALWREPTKYYEYHFFVEPIDPDNLPSGVETDSYGGTTYILFDTAIATSGSGPDAQRPTALVGYKYAGFADRFTNEYNNGSGVNGYRGTSTQPFRIYFYYTRNKHDLIYYSNGEIDHKVESIPYQASMASYGTDEHDPDPVPHHTFEGWYTSPTFSAGTEYDFANQTMPDNNVMLYAKWEPVTYTVNFYLTDADYAKGKEGIYKPDNTYTDDLTGVEYPYGPASFPVQYGDYIAQTYVEANLDYSAMVKADPNHPYNFVYWKYLDAETGEWRAFDPASPILRNMDLIGVWSSSELVDYTVNYVDQATGTVIADPIKGQALAGTTKSFDAKGGTALKEGYQSGYFPIVPSHSITMDLLDEKKNEFTFYYVKAKAVPYKVYYLAKELAPGDTSLDTHLVDGTNYYIIAETQNRPNTEGQSVVTEQYVHVDGYLVDAYQKTLMLSVKEDGNGGYVGNDAENVIYFFYTVNAKSTSYRVIHYQEVPPDTKDAIAHDGKYWVIYQQDTKPGEYDVSVAEDPLSIPYYTYDSKVKGTKTSGIPTEEEPLVLAFYYTENTATINYVPVGPNGVPWDGTGTTYVTGTTNMASETVKKVTGTAIGATATPTSNTYKFVGWYSDAACSEDHLLSTVAEYVPTKADGTVWPDTSTYYAKFEYNLTSLTITKAAGTNTTFANDEVFIFTISDGDLNTPMKVVIKGAGSVTIDGLTVGQTYTVAEDANWSWRYTCTCDKSNGQIKLVPENPATEGPENQITFTNTLDKTQWIDGNTYAENAFGPYTGTN